MTTLVRTKTGRQELRRNLKLVTKERDQLLLRLEATTKELVRCGWWTTLEGGRGPAQPSRAAGFFRGIWTALTERLNARA